VGGGKGDGGWRGWWWKTWERLILFICQNQSIDSVPWSTIQLNSKTWSVVF
jgi:hypothetical protein